MLNLVVLKFIWKARALFHFTFCTTIRIAWYPMRITHIVYHIACIGNQCYFSTFFIKNSGHPGRSAKNFCCFMLFSVCWIWWYQNLFEKPNPPPKHFLVSVQYWSWKELFWKYFRKSISKSVKQTLFWYCLLKVKYTKNMEISFTK